MSITVQPVILCGGSGTRLWPLSRAGFPKQFLSLTGKDTLFQQAVLRLSSLGDDAMSLSSPLVVGNDDHRFLMLEQLREIEVQTKSVLLEPAGRNTAPAMTLAALAAMANDTDPVLVVTAADQTVTHAQAFTRAVQEAVRTASTGDFVILGITPESPETGYGYIQTEGEGSVRSVTRFVEKPDLDTAQKYLAEGNYFWNSGMFVVKASVWIAALTQFRPDILEATQAAWNARSGDSPFVRPGSEQFKAIPSESVDYAVMEHLSASTFGLRMVTLDAGWNDLGAWDAVWKVAPKDAQGNAVQGDVILADSAENLVHATNRLVSLVGVRDLVVVETSDAVLIADRSRSQDVKKIVAQLQGEKREEHVLHRKVQRPWGWYDSIDEGSRFKVKRIMVRPGASLSLQMHYHRAEHWVVVSGTAKINNGESTIVLSENQSTYIPLGVTHRLSNPGTIPLEIIEVQSGSYLGEDDIVRFDDTYGRA